MTAATFSRSPGRAAPGRSLASVAERASPAVVAIFLLVLYFMAYRYPFQIGDSGTSPTYVDTPVALQVAKYVLLLPLALFVFLVSRGRELAIAKVDILVLILMGYSALVGLVVVADGAPGALGIVQFSFSLLLFLVFSEPSVTRRSFASWVRCLRIFFHVSLAVYAWHLGAYFLYERLPALGYYGSFPRFGGVWDDPNSAGAVFMFMLPYVAAKAGMGRRTLLVGAATAAAVLLSQSLTTYAVVAAVFAICLPLFYRSLPLQSRLLVLLLILGLAVAFVSVALFLVLSYVGLTWNGVIESMEVILESKQLSIALREESYGFAPRITPLTLLGLDPVGEFGENEWLNLLANLGLPFTAAYAVLQLLTLSHLWRWSTVAEPTQVRPAVVGMFTVYLWFFLMQINIPAAEVYPVNMIAAIIAGMAWAWRAGDVARANAARLAAGRRARDGRGVPA